MCNGKVRRGSHPSAVEKSGACPTAVLLPAELKDQHRKRRPNSTRTPSYSKRSERDKLRGTNGAKSVVSVQLFADLCIPKLSWSILKAWIFTGNCSRGNQSIYLHRSGPLLENVLDRPENRYGRYCFASFSSISISTVGVDRARVSL